MIRMIERGCYPVLAFEMGKGPARSGGEYHFLCSKHWFRDAYSHLCFV